MYVLLCYSFVQQTVTWCNLHNTNKIRRLKTEEQKVNAEKKRAENIKIKEKLTGYVC